MGVADVVRAVVVELEDGSELKLQLSRATMVRSAKQMIHLDRLDDGTWRLIWSGVTIPDFTAVRSLRMEREG